MVLFHGTDIVSAKKIEESIRLDVGSTRVDFGPGFYTTSSESTANVWAKRKATIRNKKSAIVILEFEAEFADTLIKKFGNDLTWGQFVINNRNGYGYINYIPMKDHNLDARYAITYGRIADYGVADVARTLAAKKEPLTDLSEILNPLYSFQYAFHTQEALEYVRVTNIKEV